MVLNVYILYVYELISIYVFVDGQEWSKLSRHRSYNYNRYVEPSNRT